MRASKQERAAFVFRHFMDGTHGTDGRGNYHCIHRTVSTSWDDDLDFIVDFGNEFPGTREDGNHLLAASRLRKIMTELWRDKWLERWALGNQDAWSLPGTPKWQYNYKLPQWLINDLKTGKLTPESAATAWGGEYTPVKRKCYLAHPVTDYGGTARQKRALGAIEARGWPIENPDSPAHSEAYQRRGMAHFVEVVEGCTALAFVRFPTGEIGAGVAKEIATAIRCHIPVFDASSGELKSTGCMMPGPVLSVEDTREKVRELRWFSRPVDSPFRL